MAIVGADNFRLLNAIVAINNFKPFSFVKDFFGGGEIMHFHFGTQLIYYYRRLQPAAAPSLR